MIFGSLRSRIVFFFTLLLVLVQIIAFLLINTTSLKIAKNQNIEELNTGNRIFQRLLTENRQRLIETASVLTADYGFRKAVATNDLGTILSALNNHGARIKADMMMLTSLDNTLLADTLHPTPLPRQSPLGTLIRAAETKGDASAFLLIDNQAYQVVLVPVLAPEPIAWAAMGFLVNDNLAHELRNLTNLHVSFLSKSVDNHWSLLASTQSPELRQVLVKVVSQTVASNSSPSESIIVDDYATSLSVLQQQEDFSVVTVLQRSVRDALEPLQHLRVTLLELAAASLGLSLLGGIFIADKLTHPLKMLAEVMDKIRKGDYSQTAQLYQADHVNKKNKTNFPQEVEVLRLAYVEILRLAYQDVLTGLPNRALFNDRLNQMVKLAKRTNTSFSVLMTDLDHFKFINDTLGHDAGDEVIKIVGERLQSVLRESDTIARLGGDEFAILLATGDQQKACAVVNIMQQHLEMPMLIDKQSVDVRCSIGIAIYPQHGEDAGTLVRHADVAMYVAKRSRTGAAIYNPQQDTDQQKNLSLLSELRKAVEENELELYYQPKVDLLQLHTVAVEALIRWRHPTRGMLSPINFVPFAENSGAIRLITQWVVKSAIRQCGIWLAQGMFIKVSLNISSQDIFDQNLSLLVEQALQENRVPPMMICLEITESALIRNPTDAFETLMGLRKLGVGIAIDDYGTGYSSLAYVKELPVTEMKIDRTFIGGMIRHNKNTMIVRSTIILAHNLGLNVVAEGVENEEELKLLQQLGCDQGQGYLFSKPLPSDQLQQWLSTSTWGNPPEPDAMA